MRICLNILFLSLCSTFLFNCNGNSSSGEAAEESVAPLAAGDVETPEEEEEEKVILFFGNSLTAGYGLDPSESFPTLIQERIDSLGLNYKVVNAGLSGETTAGGNSRLDWVLERQPVDIFVLELGANDGLRGLDTEETEKNLKEMIDKVRKVNPDVEIVLAGMLVPPSMGQDYSRQFARIYPAVAEERDVHLIPFLLEDVAGEPELNQNDGIHPTAEGAEIVAENVWEVLGPILEEEKQERS